MAIWKKRLSLIQDDRGMYSYVGHSETLKNHEFGSSFVIGAKFTKSTHKKKLHILTNGGINGSVPSRFLSVKRRLNKGLRVSNIRVYPYISLDWAYKIFQMMINTVHLCVRLRYAHELNQDGTHPWLTDSCISVHTQLSACVVCVECSLRCRQLHPNDLH